MKSTRVPSASGEFSALSPPASEDGIWSSGIGEEGRGYYDSEGVWRSPSPKNEDPRSFASFQAFVEGRDRLVVNPSKDEDGYYDAGGIWRENRAGQQLSPVSSFHLSPVASPRLRTPRPKKGQKRCKIRAREL